MYLADARGTSLTRCFSTTAASTAGCAALSAGEFTSCRLTITARFGGEDDYYIQLSEVGFADAAIALCVAGLDVPGVGSLVRRWSLSHHLHSQEEGKGTRGRERKMERRGRGRECQGVASELRGSKEEVQAQRDQGLTRQAGVGCDPRTVSSLSCRIFQEFRRQRPQLLYAVLARLVFAGEQGYEL